MRRRPDRGLSDPGARHSPAGARGRRRRRADRLRAVEPGDGQVQAQRARRSGAAFRAQLRRSRPAGSCRPPPVTPRGPARRRSPSTSPNSRGTSIPARMWVTGSSASSSSPARRGSAGQRSGSMPSERRLTPVGRSAGRAVARSARRLATPGIQARELVLGQRVGPALQAQIAARPGRHGAGSDVEPALVRSRARSNFGIRP